MPSTMLNLSLRHAASVGDLSLLRYRALAELLDPPWLRAKMAEEVRRLAGLYGDDMLQYGRPCDPISASGGGTRLWPLISSAPHAPAPTSSCPIAPSGG
jgi:hypothetical protein